MQADFAEQLSGYDRNFTPQPGSDRATPDLKIGIGGWTDRQIKEALTNDKRPDGSRLASPMPWRYLATMREEDIDAIVAYLQTLKPLAN